MYRIRLFAGALLLVALTAVAVASPSYAQDDPCYAAERQYDPNPDNDCGNSNTTVVEPDDPTDPPEEPEVPGDSGVESDSQTIIDLEISPDAEAADVVVETPAVASAATSAATADGTSPTVDSGGGPLAVLPDTGGAMFLIPALGMVLALLGAGGLRLARKSD